MWFKNCHIYQIPDGFSLSADEFAEKLEDRRFKPCARMADKTIGWVSPIHRNKEYLIHAAGGCVLFCMRKEQKMIPASAIKEALEEKITTMQDELGRKVYSKEKQTIKEDIVSMMLPNAFPRSSHVLAYIDTKNRLLIIDGSSSSQVDEFYELLLESIGSFGAMQFIAEENPAAIMSQWIFDGAPQDWLLSGEYLLKEPKDERVAKFKDNDGENHYVAELLKDGYLINRLGIHFKSLMQATIQDDLQIKGIKFNHELLKENDELSGEDELVKFDADFVLMTAALADFIAAIQEIFKVKSIKIGDFD
jgi:recombination associated protein RdgC